MRPVPVGLDPDDLRAFLGDILDAITERQTPTQPTTLWSCASTALPPAAAWPNCILRLTDIATLAASDGVHWTRVDTGGVL